MTVRSRSDLGLLALRAGLGATIAAHGAQKLFGWFGGGGLEGTTGAMEAMGFQPAERNATMSALAETGGGALLAVGLATPVAGAAVAANFLAAASVHRPAGFWVTEGGFEYTAVLGLSGAAFALGGPGAYSLDRLLGDRLNRPWMGTAALLVLVGASAVVVRKRQQVVDAAPTTDEEQVDEGTDVAAHGA